MDQGTPPLTLCYRKSSFLAVNRVILASVALAVNLMPFLATIPLLVPNVAHIGTAVGIWKCWFSVSVVVSSCCPLTYTSPLGFLNSARVILLVSAGAIQDATPTGRET